MEPQTNASCWAQIKWQANMPKEQDEGWGMVDWGLRTADGGHRRWELRWRSSRRAGRTYGKSAASAAQLTGKY